MYEIPNHLKQLYAHWNDHTSKIQESKANIQINKSVLAQIDKFITERMHVWHKRYTAPEHKPYTKDPILNQYRFCNIYRELDRQTIDIHTLCAPLKHDFELWLLNIAFCRFVCNPQTIKDVGFLSFDQKNNTIVNDKLINHARPKYGVAYIFPISTIQRSSTPTRELFFTQHLPRVIPRIADNIRAKKKASVRYILDEVLPLFEFNLAFHWTEILIDVAYQFPQLIDLFKEFPIGPGSAPTMARLNDNVNPQHVPLALVSYKPALFPYLTYDGKPVLLSAENWEGIGCEFRKYTNLESGNGRRRIYSHVVKNNSTKNKKKKNKK